MVQNSGKGKALMNGIISRFDEENVGDIAMTNIS